MSINSISKERAMRELKKIWGIAGYKPTRFIFLTILGCAVSLMTVSMGIIYGSLINMVAEGESIKKVIFYCILSAVYVLSFCLLRWYSDFATNKYVNDLTAIFRAKYVDGLLNSKFSNIINDNSAKYLNHLEADIPNVVASTTYNLYFVIVNVVLVIGTFIAVLVVNWKILVTMLGFVLIMAILPLFIKKKLDKSILEVSKVNRTYIGILKEYILGVSIVKNFCAEDSAKEKIDQRSNEFRRTKIKNIKINSVASGLGTLVKQVAVVSLIALTCYFVYTKEVGIGSVLTIFSVGNSFFSSILGVSAVVTYLFSISSLRDDVFKVIDVERTERVKEFVFNNEILIDNVSFNYPNSKEKKVLNALSAKFEKNKKYLILGKSGSGKSTLLKLLCAEYEAEGNMTVDGVPYREFSEKDISDKIAVSRQQCYIFDRSLRYNIDFLETGDEQRLEEVIKNCELNDFVSRLPDGLDTVLDEEINQVSGGEKLRINLARALYRDSEILLLDEVTSALDKTMSELIENYLLQIEDKTIINVSHKFNDKTLSIYDRIYIIEDGKVALEGDFNQLKDNAVLASYRNISKDEPN